MYEFETRYTTPDLAVLCRCYARLFQRWQRVAHNLFLIALSVIGLVFGALLTAVYGRLTLSSGYLLVVGMLFLALFLLRHQLMALRSKSLLLDKSGEVAFRLEEEEIEGRTPSETSRYRYDVFKGAAETRDTFLLFLGQHHGLVFPKRDLPDVDGVRAFLQQKLSCEMQTMRF